MKPNTHSRMPEQSPSIHPAHGQAGCATAQPAQPGDRVHEMPTPTAASVPGRPEGTRIGDTARAWTSCPPLPYRNDEPSPAHWFWIELGPRIRRRPRCGEIVED